MHIVESRSTHSSSFYKRSLLIWNWRFCRTCHFNHKFLVRNSKFKLIQLLCIHYIVLYIFFLFASISLQNVKLEISRYLRTWVSPWHQCWGKENTVFLIPTFLFWKFCLCRLRTRPETQVDNEKLKVIMEVDPSQTTSELAAAVIKLF